MRDHGRFGPLDWAVAVRPIDGEQSSGDDWIVTASDANALIGVVDGLGHGAPAAAAAQRALRVVAENPEQPLDTLIAMCHAELEGTRGGAMTLVRIGFDGALQWLGVGNVGAYLVRMGTMGTAIAQAAMLRGGILGHALPSPLRVRETAMLPGDLLLIGTDGLMTGFEGSADLSMSTVGVAGAILDNCGKHTDDALVLAVRHRGPSR